MNTKKYIQNKNVKKTFKITVEKNGKRGSQSFRNTYTADGECVLAGEFVFDAWFEGDDKLYHVLNRACGFGNEFGEYYDVNPFVESAKLGEKTRVVVTERELFPEVETEELDDPDAQIVITVTIEDVEYLEMEE